MNAIELAAMECRKNNEDIVVAGIIVQIRAHAFAARRAAGRFLRCRIAPA